MIWSTLLWLSSAIYVSAAPSLTYGTQAQAFGVTKNASLADNQTFDFIIVGGGAGGLSVARRLAESLYTVLVIEAGPDTRNDSNVYDLYNNLSNIGNKTVDWQWKTEHGTMSGGKSLGGSTAINGGLFMRGTVGQYDSWSQLLEDSEADVGWNWEDFSAYMRKAEELTPPNDEQRAIGADYVSENHGTDGPLKVSFPDDMYDGPDLPAFFDAITNITGIDQCPDLGGGDPNCVSMMPFALNSKDRYHRSSAASAYLTPVEATATTWLTLTEHQVTQLTWSNAGDIPLTASGVEFAPASGGNTRFKAFASKEVIVSAGAIGTPRVLQLSGIGDSELLSSLNITTNINLTTVGRNLQEQTSSSVSFLSNGFEYEGRPLPELGSAAFPNIQQLFGANADSYIDKIKSNISDWAISQAGSGLSATALEEVFKVQAALIIEDNAPVAELLQFHNGLVGFVLWQLLPFSRGAVKIISSDPFAKPDVRVGFFEVDFDMDVQVALTNLTRQIMTAEPMKNLTSFELQPGRGVDNSYDSWRKWIQSSFTPVFHPIGSCAMMRRSLGGVVDAHLKVYDTSNVRVVDASIMPLQISSHLSATVYGIAEKAADIIKADY